MPVIQIIGDSTVEDNKPPFRGWGWALPNYVREGVGVSNHALSGRSSRSFRTLPPTMFWALPSMILAMMYAPLS